MLWIKAMKKHVYIIPEICVINEYERLCQPPPELPISLYPPLAKEQPVLFMEDEEDEDLTWLKEK